MALNCKPDDLAMIVRDYGDEEIRKYALGLTVQVVEIEDYEEEVGARWKLAETLMLRDGRKFAVCADMILMPINRPANNLPAVDKVVDLETV